MAKIIDEKQTGNYRLLVPDKKLDIGNHKSVKINGKEFAISDVYDLPNLIAIRCSSTETSFINSIICF